MQSGENRFNGKPGLLIFRSVASCHRSFNGEVLGNFLEVPGSTHRLKLEAGVSWAREYLFPANIIHY